MVLDELKSNTSELAAPHSHFAYHNLMMSLRKNYVRKLTEKIDRYLKIIYTIVI
jgi:hypothetical protein